MVIDMNIASEYIKNCTFIEDMLATKKTDEEKLFFLELHERQKYNYYCARTENFWNWTKEEDQLFQMEWDYLIERAREIREKIKTKKKVDEFE